MAVRLSPVCLLLCLSPLERQGLVAMMVQIFFARRILILTRKKSITALVFTTSCITGRMFLAPHFLVTHTTDAPVCAVGTAIGVGMRPAFTSLQSLKASTLGLPAAPSYL